MDNSTCNILPAISCNVKIGSNKLIDFDSCIEHMRQYRIRTGRDVTRIQCGLNDYMSLRPEFDRYRVEMEWEPSRDNDRIIFNPHITPRDSEIRLSTAYGIPFIPTQT